MIRTYENNSSFLCSTIIIPLDFLQFSPAGYMAGKYIFRVFPSKPFLELTILAAENNGKNRLCSIEVMWDDTGISILRISVLKLS